MIGRWDRWFADPGATRGITGISAPGPRPIGLTGTYQIGADWLAECNLIEDWGCGFGWLRTMVEPERYRGIDGSKSPYADEIADLVSYRSEVPGIFMRHVLEHNDQWATILDNAVASFTQRMTLILFTPMVEQTRQIAWLNELGVPDISFRHEDLTERFGEAVHWTHADYKTVAAYGKERVYFLEKSP